MIAMRKNRVRDGRAAGEVLHGEEIRCENNYLCIGRHVALWIADRDGAGETYP